MTKKGQRAADRRRERIGAEPIEEDAGEATALHPLNEEWIGTDEDFGPQASAESDLSPSSAFDEPQITGEIAGDIVAASQRIEGKKELEETGFSQRPRVPDPYGARLSVIAGPDKGRGQDLIFAEMIIGRSDRADMVLRDDSVSREHFALRWNQHNFELVDLGSEAGTRVNGGEVSRYTLNFGDEIELGDTILRFLPGDLRPSDRPGQAVEGTLKVARPEGTAVVRRAAGPSKSGYKKIILVLALIAAFALVLGLGHYAYQAYRRGVIQVGRDPGIVALLQQAQEALDAQDYALAKRIAATVLETHPKDEKALQILTKSTQAIDIINVLKELTAAVDRGQLEQAQQLQKKLPVGSAAFKQAGRLIAALIEELRNTDLDAARRLIDQGAFTAAEALLEKHDQRWPQDDEADALRFDISARRDAAQQHRQHVKDAKINASLRPASLAYSQGKLGRTRALLAKLYKGPSVAAAKKMRSAVDRFEQLFAQGQKAHRSKQAKKGLLALNQAHAIDRRYAPRGSIYSQRLARWRGDLYYQLGVRLLTDGRGCEALSYFKQAQRANPADGKSKKQWQKLRKSCGKK